MDLPTLGRDALAGVISAVVQIAYCISFSALIFQGAIASGFSLGLAALIMGTVVTGLVVALTSTLSPAGAGPDTPAIAVMSVLAGSIAAALAAKGVTTQAIILNVMVAISVSTLFTGFLLFGLGALGSGAVLRRVRRRGAVLEADRVDQLLDPLMVGLAAGDRERQDQVLLGGEDRQQVEELEDEAELVATQPGQLGVVEAGDLLAVEDDRPRGRPVEAGEDVHQGRLARARGPHDRGEAAALEAGSHLDQSVDRRRPFAEATGDAVGLDHLVHGCTVPSRPGAPR